MVKQVVKTISVSYLKANCSRVLDEVEYDGVKFVVTLRGEPMVRTSPAAKRGRTRETTPQRAALPVSDFRARCLELVKEVSAQERGLAVSRHGRVVARVMAEHRRPRWPFPDLSDWIECEGDIISPIDIEWEAMQ